MFKDKDKYLLNGIKIFEIRFYKILTLQNNK